MRDDARNVCELGLGFVDDLRHGEHRRPAIERADLVAAVLLPLRELADDVFEIFFQGSNGVLRGLTFGFRPGIKLVGRHDLAVARRDQGKAHGDAQDRDVLPGSLVAQRRKRLALFGLERLIDHTPPRLVIFALKHRRQRRLQIVDQRMHRIAKLHGAAGEKADADRLVRFREVVDIDPIGGARLGWRLLLQERLDRLLHARAARADDEHVETRLFDPGAKPDRSMRPPLPNQPVDRLDIRRRLERHGGEIGRPIQALDRERSRGADEIAADGARTASRVGLPHFGVGHGADCSFIVRSP